MKKPSVLVSTVLPGNSQDLLAEDFELKLNEGAAYSPDELIENARGKDAVISVLSNRLDEKFFAACPDIKIVANVAVGFDNIDLEAAGKRGIIVCNTPGVLTESTADLAFALMLACARRLPEAERYLREGQWKSFALDLLLGVDVHHKTLGIIGLGRIGQATARRARGFSMQILYNQRKRAEEKTEAELNARFVELDELLSSSDFVSIHCPLTPETTHLIGAEQLKRMKPGAIMINTARGAVLDEKALQKAVSDRIIYGAALDVYENEPTVLPDLLECENVVLLPHIGSATRETRTAMGRLAVEAVLKAFSGRLPENTINKNSWQQFLKRAEALGFINA